MKVSTSKQGVSRHNEVLKYLKDFNLYYMRMPSAKEATYDLKISNGSLHRILARLEEKGQLERIPTFLLPYRIK